MAVTIPGLAGPSPSVRRSSTDPDGRRFLLACGLTALVWGAFAAVSATMPVRWSLSGGTDTRPAASRSVRVSLSAAPVGKDLPAPVPERGSIDSAQPPAVLGAPSVSAVLQPAGEGLVVGPPAVPVDIASDAVSGAGSADTENQTLLDQSAPAARGNLASAGDSAGSGADEAFLRWFESTIRERMKYPERARRRNIEGTVVLSLSVPADGSRCAVSVLESSGSATLDGDAVRLVESLFPCPVAPQKEFSAPVKFQYLLGQELP